MSSDDRLLFESLTLFVDIAEATKKRRPGFLSTAWSHVRRAGGDVTAAYEKIKRIPKKHPEGYKSAVRTAKVVTVVALLAAGAYAYNRFLTKAARKCSDYAGSDKTECMKRVRAGASDAEMNELKKSMALCSMSSDPMTCKKRLKDRITKVSEQLEQLRSGVALRD